MRSAGGRWVGALLAAGLMVTAACGGDDDDSQDDSDADEAPETPSTPEEAVDPYDGHTSETYDGTTNWLCHPDLAEDECADLSATSIAADGTAERADLEAAEDPSIDCFYIYPTVSLDPGPNSDLRPDEQERTTVGAQAAPFATTCRVFAPVYPQVVLAAIGAGGFEDAGPIAYAGVLDAWQTYISQHNEGRGVILIGHSQGTGMLNQLIANEIDDNEDLRSRLVSAVLLGGSVRVPDGETVGGQFANVPGCESAEDLGCVITFSSYPTASPPAEGAIFGRPGFGPTPSDGGDTDRALCVDPVSLAGGNGLADAIVPTKAPLVGAGGESAAAAAGIDTRYIVLPEILEGSCVQEGAYDFFGVGPASADDKRTAAVTGLLEERLGDTWGLHLQDAQLAMGDLLEIASQQANAYTNR